MDGDATAKGVSNNHEAGIGSCPGERTGGQDEEDLGDVEALVVGDVTYTVRETTAKEVLGGVTRPRSALVTYCHSH